jgi:O-antigen/teichoic acid export membrane protein
MSHEDQASKNFAWNTMSQMVIRAASFLYFIIMYRRLKDVGMGEYNFVLSFTSFWFLIVDFGIVGYLTREWSSKKTEFQDIKSDFYVAFYVRMFLFVFIFLPFLAVNYFINKDIYLSLVLSAISISMSLFASLIDGYYQASNQFRHLTVRQIIERVGIVFLGSISLLLLAKVEVVFLATIAGQFISILYSYFFTQISLQHKLSFDYSRAKILLIKGAPFMFVTLFWSIYARIDMVMLKYMANFQVVGWYGAAYKFLDLSLVFPTVLLIPAVYPVLNSMSHDSEIGDELDNFIDRILRVLFSSGVILTLFFFLFAPVLMPMLFTSLFDGGILALRILIATQIISSMTIFFNYLLFTQGNEKISLYAVIFCGLINIGLNIFLIPKYSLYGSAWATVVAEVVNLLLLQYYAVWKKNLRQLWGMISVILLNSALMYVIGALGYINDIPVGAILILTNIAALFLLRLITIEDCKFFLRPFKVKFLNYYDNLS